MINNNDDNNGSPMIIQGSANPGGMKKAPMAMPTTTRNLIPQKPFWIPDRGSCEDLTPSMISSMRKKKPAKAKQIR